MTNQAPKTDLRGLVHHPSAVLDDLCTYTAQNQAWTDFDRQITADLREMEERFRPYWTTRAIRKSLGR
jgi:hypothetical protein